MQAPIHVSELELTEPIIDIDLPAPVDGVPYTGVYLLVRLQRVPVSYTFIAGDRLKQRARRHTERRASLRADARCCALSRT